MLVLAALGVLFPPQALAGALGDSIGLSQEQRSQIKELIKEHREELAQLRSQIREKRQEIEKLFWEGTSQEELSSLIKELEELEGQAAVARIELALKIREVLTDEQLEKLHELWQRRPKARGPVPSQRRGSPPALENR